MKDRDNVAKLRRGRKSERGLRLSLGILGTWSVVVTPHKIISKMHHAGDGGIQLQDWQGVTGDVTVGRRREGGRKGDSRREKRWSGI